MFRCLRWHRAWWRRQRRNTHYWLICFCFWRRQSCYQVRTTSKMSSLIISFRKEICFEKEINTGNSVIRTKEEVVWRDGDSGSGKWKSPEEKREKLCPFVGELVVAECFQWCNGSSLWKTSSDETTYWIIMKNPHFKIGCLCKSVWSEIGLRWCFQMCDLKLKILVSGLLQCSSMSMDGICMKFQLIYSSHPEGS
jgi:hypothetical protein